MSPGLITLALPLAALGTIALLTHKFRRWMALPPGPKQLPLLGNLLDMPKEMEWLKFTEWGHKFGDIMSVSFIGQPIIILNSYDMASDLLEKKEMSDRPTFVMGGELAGWVSALPFTRYGERFRAIRRHMAGTLSVTPVKRFEGLQERKTLDLAQRLLDSPDRVLENIRHHVGAVILNISYGYDPAPENDPLVKLAEKANEELSEALRPGVYLVDVLPWLRYVPYWFPGAGFKKTAQAWLRTIVDLSTIPYDMVVQKLKDGSASPSFLATMLEECKENMSKFDEDAIRWAAAGVYGGGADTTVAAITNFFLAMTLNPIVQLKAQEEIDAVIGRDRLPGFKDRLALPYVDALVKEVLRWGPVAPSGVPHLAMSDCFYKGYLIPKKSIVMANIWAMHRDERSYPNAAQFDPSRYLDKSNLQRDPHLSAFGFGRRLCPGLNLADETLYITCVRTLALFNIGESVNAEGEYVSPKAQWTPGVISHPVPFLCNIKPRSVMISSMISKYSSEPSV